MGTGRRQQTPAPTDKERRSRRKKGKKNSPPTAFGQRLNHADVATSSRPSGSAAFDHAPFLRGEGRGVGKER